MDPLNPIRPAVPTPRVRPAGDKVQRREPGTGSGLQKKDNHAERPKKPDSGDHHIDELA